MGSRYRRIREHRGVSCPRSACIKSVTPVTVACEAVPSHNVPDGGFCGEGRAIVLVGAGQVVQRGTHRELLAAGGLYAELYHRLVRGDDPVG